MKKVCLLVLFLTCIVYILAPLSTAEAFVIYDGGYNIRSDNNSSNAFGGILLILVGLLGAFFPYGAWWLEIGWKLDNAEPSELALFANRALGIIISIIE